MSETPESPSADSPSEETPAPRSARGAWILIACVLVVSTVLGVVFTANYMRFLRYVSDTLEEPTEPPVWETAELSPEACVDATLDWAAGCRGIKVACDEYVPRVIRECLRTQDRTAYCMALGEATHSTEFGHEECMARGVQRNVDAEACSGAYRGIDEYCQFVVWQATSETAER